MPRPWLPLLFGCAFARMAMAASALVPPSGGDLCRPALLMAAQTHGIPPALMAAIGQVESGRRDPVSGAVQPWPWTIDAEGQGAFYDTAAQAVAAVQSAQAKGIRSIDVGCMQVNLLHHPHAFASLGQAFDPAVNADYAAGYLHDLYLQTGSWPKAAALYHSATPELAADYQRKVMALWSGAPLGDTAPRFRLVAAGGASFHPAAPASRQMAGGRVLPAASTPDTAGNGRGLAAYRAAPVIAGWRHFRR